MRRSWWRRPLAAFVAIWLALVVGEPGIVHACPMHGGATASHAAAGMHGAGGMAAHEHGAHHGARPAHGPADSGHHHRGCTCIGACTGAGLAVALPQGGIELASAATIDVRAARSATWSPIRQLADHALPFANGPPAPARA